MASKRRKARQASGNKAKPTENQYLQHWLALCLIVATAAVFAPLLGHDFLEYDDPLYVTANPDVQAGLTLEGLRWAWTTNHAANWHPVTWVSHLVDVELFGLEPWGHHLMSLLFHIANTLLLFLLLVRMTKAAWPSALVAALFALHPLRLESVAWVAERKDVLSTFLGLVTVGAYLRYVEHKGTGRTGRYLLVFLSFALALMAKPMVVTLPFLLLLLDAWPLKRLQWTTAWPRIREKIPLLLLSATSSYMTLLAQTGGGAVNLKFSLGTRVANAVLSYVRYLGAMFWPRDLAVFYPHPSGGIEAWRVAVAAVLLISITAAALLLARRCPYLPVGWFWFLGTLVPVIGLVQVGSQAMADRYSYLPSIGIGIVVVWGAAELAAREPRVRTVLGLGAGAALISLAMCTRAELPNWRSSRALFTHALRVTEGNHIAHGMLALDLSKAGELEESIAHCTEALRLAPDDERAHNNLGNTLVLAGRSEEAIPHYLESLQLKPDNAGAYFNLGSAYFKLERIDDAIDAFREAVRLDADHAEARYSLGVSLTLKGETEEAVHQFDETVKRAPDYSDAHFNLALLLEQLGRTDAALEHYRDVVRLEPESTDVRRRLDALMEQVNTPE